MGNADEKLPYGKVDSVVAVGELVRTRRKELGYTKATAAGLLGVGERFLSELERGKTTAEVARFS
ncbi:MAG: helix-turn-helix domain-containing protein [Myxococcales bacterium]|nr:helix-turn-helix domain-containing protein [Myxococcales bacterium]